MPQFTRLYVLYKEDNDLGKVYWQIAARPSDDGTHFWVKNFGGQAIMTPEFVADNPDAEVDVYVDETASLNDADAEFRQRVAAGWVLYTGVNEWDS